MLTLYSHYQSAAAYRVRIALHMKGAMFETVPVQIDKGEQFDDFYRLINPMVAVPVLDDDGFRVSQSLAILNYLDNIMPEPPLAPVDDARGQAYVREAALTVASDIHPLINMKVLEYLGTFGLDQAQKDKWLHHWVSTGLNGLETLLAESGRVGDFANGNAVSVADICIVPQLYAARRYGVDLKPYAICRKIEANCMALPAFQQAAPEMQPDAPHDLQSIHGALFKPEA